MRRSVAQDMREKALEIAKWYSDPSRAKNTQQLTYKLDDLLPLSENTGAAIFLKSDGKRMVAFLFWFNVGADEKCEHCERSGKKGRWEYLIPTDSHITGMVKMPNVLWGVEKMNFEHNWD